jgi:hypothetical protein
VSNLFSKIAESSDFVAFNAHWGFAFFLMTAARGHLPLGIVAASLIGLAAVKEFFVDVRYEDNPPQTYADGVKDFAGYVFGIALGALI